MDGSRALLIRMMMWCVHVRVQMFVCEIVCVRLYACEIVCVAVIHLLLL